MFDITATTAACHRFIKDPAAEVAVVVVVVVVCARESLHVELLLN